MKRKGRKKWILLVVLVLVAALIVLNLAKRGGETQYTEVEVSERDITTYLEFSGNIEASESRNVYAEATAKILELLVEEGDEVQEGDVIAVLDSGDVEYNIELQELALELSELSDQYSIKDSQTSLSQLEEQLSEGMNSSVNSAEQALLSAQEAYESAADSYNRAEADFAAGTTSSIVSARQSLSSAQATYDQAYNQWDEDLIDDDTMATYAVTLQNAQENYDLAVENAEQDLEDLYDAMVDAEDALMDAERNYETVLLSVEQSLESYENAVEKTEALTDERTTELEIEHLKESLEDYTILAPISGYITSLTIEEGEYTTSALQVAEVTSFDVMEVSIQIDEYDVAGVSEGDAVEIYIDALDATYEGTIASISKVATISNNVSYLDAVVEFEADDQVRSGFSAEVTLVKADEKGVAALPISYINYNTDNTAYVYVRDEDGDVAEQTVSLGVSDSSWVQITEGLEIGDTILVEVSTGASSMIEQRQEMMTEMMQ